MTDQQDEEMRRLEDLESRIEEKRRALNQQSALTGPLKAEWDDMLRRHADIRRRMRKGEIKGSEAVKTLQLDVDVLQHAFFRWAARVDQHFKAQPKK